MWKNFALLEGKSVNLLQANYTGTEWDRVRFQNYVSDLYLSQVSGKLQSGSDTCVISERSLLSNLSIFIEPAFEAGLIAETDYCLLKDKLLRFHDLLTRDCATFFIYLESSVESCMRRIAERGRCEEKTITTEFMETMLVNHDRFYSSLSQHPKNNVLVINLDQKTEIDNRIDLESVAQQILFHVGQNMPKSFL